MSSTYCRNVDIIGVQVDLGASRRGVDMGPSAIRYADIVEKIESLGYKCFDKGDITTNPSSGNMQSSDCRLKNIHVITKANESLYEKVRDSLLNNHFPIVLGGDHSIAAGSILGVQSVYENIGIIWIDAHGDFNNEKTTPSGNLHGMSLSAITGYGPKEMVSFKPDALSFVNPNNTVLIGTRSLDNEEKKMLKKSGAHVFTMTDIDKYGMKDIMKMALDIASDGTKGFCASFDMDAITPNEAPGVGTPVYGGLTIREAHLAAEMIAESHNLLSAEIVELNPILDDKNRTGELAVELILSLLEKTIY